ncbi:hypothetical protein BN14_11179 [Rhizoctonia solani AG-1 IB]|uniref:Uncharacterized protein n=1 Tax=Thanatephorus cucumeris (strain AG1-IB / isolate 7/3/14) TaxID=1108050 RepID=M5CCL7_THACB|nr:hypothetical protein BN14_11179 [Rhizoctonia solani AG-1 IB]
MEHLSVAAYGHAGQFLISQLEQEVNSKRAPHILGSHRTWEELTQLFRVQLIKYMRQLPPFDQHNKDDTPIEYWSRLLDREDASILAYLAIKLFSIATNSIPDEHTGSAFTRINSSDQSNQNASTVVAMVQVLQHEHRNSHHQCNPTLIRFRDVPGLIRSTDGLPATPLKDAESDSDTDELEVSESDDECMPSNNNNPESTVDLDEPGDWEIEAGLDEEPEQAPGVDTRTPGQDCFEVAQLNGVDLSNPLLWDLLCDTPDQDSEPESNVSTIGTQHITPFADIHASPTTF